MKFISFRTFVVDSVGLASAMAAPAEIVLRDGLAVRTSGGRGGRSAFHTDPVEEQIVTGRWTRPMEGGVVALAGGTNRVWEAVKAREDGSFTNAALRGGYVFLPMVSDRERTLMLEAQGHTMVYVNGEPRAGDVYSNGSVALPVRVLAGTNEFLFAVGRGSLRARLTEPKREVGLDLRDSTTPDLVVGEKNEMPAAVLVVNSTTNFARDLALRVSGKGGKTVTTAVPAVPPLSTRKVGFAVNHSGKSDTNQVEFTLALVKKEGRKEEGLDTAKLTLRLRAADEKRRETFVSGMDGSVQYFAVTPAQPLGKNPPPPALVLTAHGASVEAQGQAAAYGAKTWAHIVAPTNRRAYGFDWEDWGRRDAMEVLDLAMKKYGTDPRQTYLTGHSMGGHGTWHLGVTFPDRFAAIAPSAGWVSFFSYAGGARDEATNALRQLIQRAATPSDTLALASNYLHQGIYILHGDADDNVPVREARTMREALGKFHRDFTYHEQPGAGHWWGNACVDWPPIFDLFARHKIPDAESVTAIHFTTANPGVSSKSHWVSIEAQVRDLAPSTVDIKFDRGGPTFKGVTENVALLALDLRVVGKGKSPTVELDGQKAVKIEVEAGAEKAWLRRSGDGWAQVGRPSLAEKGPHRYGPFKEAFNHRMIFVYGTKGTAEENAWAFSKARYDAETFWYRGNGSIDVVPDTAFDAGKEKDRSVILYGHAESHGSWAALLGESPVQAGRGGIRIGKRELKGKDLACLFLRPRPGSEVACVGVVTGTGLAGMKLTDRVPYFSAGVAFPDCTVFGPDSLSKGADGARAAGYFGRDWSVEGGEFVWRDL